MQWALRAAPLSPSSQAALVPGSARRAPQQDTKCHAEPLAFAAFHFALAASSGTPTQGRAAGGEARLVSLRGRDWEKLIRARGVFQDAGS